MEYYQTFTMLCYPQQTQVIRYRINGNTFVKITIFFHLWHAITNWTICVHYRLLRTLPHHRIRATLDNRGSCRIRLVNHVLQQDNSAIQIYRHVWDGRRFHLLRYYHFTVEMQYFRV
ncbi:uncharacterized protein LOC113790170 [Dermatophagoides pteronyssinus]|uniref:uncharacterized protein LOC113790170 n=1 Tax=Dermatophagoides pteronyssinus TaxID=6956 RepID=UPI003F669CA4